MPPIFVDRTTEFGLTIGHRQGDEKLTGLERVTSGMGCVTADFDNDGDADLFIANIGQNLLFRNNGDSTFSDATAGSGLGGCVG